jgi:hypothetical protein
VKTRGSRPPERKDREREETMNRAESIFVTVVAALIVGSFLLLCLSGIITPIIGEWMNR